MKRVPLFSLITACLFAFLGSPLSAVPIDLSVGTTAQSSQLNNFGPELAIDGVENFTYTFNTDTNPTWQILRPSSFSFQTVTILGRDSNRLRFRDITIEVVAFSGDVNADFTGGTVVYSSPLLNPNNILNGPNSLSVEVGGYHRKHDQGEADP